MAGLFHVLKYRPSASESVLELVHGRNGQERRIGSTQELPASRTGGVDRSRSPHRAREQAFSQHREFLQQVQAARGEALQRYAALELLPYGDRRVRPSAPHRRELMMWAQEDVQHLTRCELDEFHRQRLAMLQQHRDEALGMLDEAKKRWKVSLPSVVAQQHQILHLQVVGQMEEAVRDLLRQEREEIHRHRLAMLRQRCDEAKGRLDEARKDIVVCNQGSLSHQQQQQQLEEATMQDLLRQECEEIHRHRLDEAMERHENSVRLFQAIEWQAATNPALREAVDMHRQVMQQASQEAMRQVQIMQTGRQTRLEEPFVQRAGH